jgi:hypothetical protein
LILSCMQAKSGHTAIGQQGCNAFPWRPIYRTHSSLMRGHSAVGTSPHHPCASAHEAVLEAFASLPSSKRMTTRVRHGYTCTSSAHSRGCYCPSSLSQHEKARGAKPSPLQHTKSMCFRQTKASCDSAFPCS